MRSGELSIVVDWDSEAEVYYVKESDITGLHLEATSVEQMCELLNEYVPYLLRENGIVINLNIRKGETEKKQHTRARIDAAFNNRITPDQLVRA